MSIASRITDLVDALAGAINDRAGKVGASAYDLYVLNGGTLSQADWLNSLSGVNPGDVKTVATATAPTGWLICDGSAVSRTTYSALFAAIGTTYGAGDGSTTFSLPDLRGRVPAGRLAGDASFGTLGAQGGEKTHVLSAAEMPSHSHGVTDPGHSHTQSAHGHAVSDNGHSHNMSHGHSVSDGGHYHTGQTANGGGHSHVPSGAGNTFWTGGSGGAANVANGSGTNRNTTGSTSTDGDHNHTFGTSTSGTGVGVNGVSMNTNNVSAAITQSNAQPAIQSSGTGISVGSAGSGAAHNNLQPYVVMNFAIKF